MKDRQFIAKEITHVMYSIIHVLFITHTSKLTIEHLENYTHYLVIYLVSSQTLGIRKSEVQLG